MKFEFSLSALLTLKKAQEQKALKEWSFLEKNRRQALAYEEFLNTQIEQSKERRWKLWQNLEGPLPQALSQTEDQFLQGSQAQKVKLQGALFRIQKAIEKSKKKVLQTQAEIAALLKLESKQKEAFRQEVLKKEQKALEDLLSMRSHLKQKMLIALLALSQLFSLTSLKANETDSSTSDQDAPGISCLQGELIFQDLEQKKQHLDAREKELNEQAQRLKAQEQTIKESIARFEKLVAEQSKGEVAANKARQEELSKLVETYLTMSPKPLASVLGSLDEKLAIQVMNALEPVKLAKVLNLMDAKLSSHLSELLTGYSPPNALNRSSNAAATASKEGKEL